MFSTLAGAEVARIRGAHGGAGRARAAGLLDAWRALPDGIARREIDRLQARYDERLREDWLRKGRAVLDAVLGADAPDALPRTKDFLASDPGFLFAAKAGEEMERGGLKDAAWTKSALAAAAAHRAAVMLGTEAPALARLRAAGQTAQSLLGADAPKETAETLDKLSAAAKRLNAHRAVLAALHPRSGDGAALAELAAELYAPPGGKEPPPSLADAESAWESLEAALRALEPAFAEPEGKDILALLKSRQTLLHRAALAHAAARVDAEWDALVFQPFAALEGDGALLHLLDGNPPGAFAKGFARHFLVSREGRRRAATALGIAFPFLPEALDWLDDASARIAELEREYPVTLDLLPVTAGKGARVFPRGIRFTLRGGKAPVSALGYNHKASLSFTWSARASSGAEVEIPFDSAVLRKAWPGALGFVRFLQSLDGERLFLPPEAFPDFPDDLRRGGVEGVTAHVAVTDPGGAAGLRTEALKPPAKAVRTEP